MKIIKIILILLFTGLAGTASGFFAPEDRSADEGDHEKKFLSQYPGICQECHSTREIERRLKDPTFACADVCRKCHKKREDHHPVGKEITFKVKSELPFLSGKRISCITCHDLKIKRFCTQGRKARSLFSRMFRAQKQYKTYFLRMDNRKGQLCKQCH